MNLIFTWRPVRQLMIDAGPGVTYMQENINYSFFQ